MKKALSILILLVALTSCTEDLKSNNPSLQGLKDNVLWRAKDVRATVGVNNSLIIQALNQYETLTLNTTSTNVGTYALGTTNQGNKVSYIWSVEAENIEYQTIPVSGSVKNIILSNGGTGYVQAAGVVTTGGSGSGLKVKINVSASGVVNEVEIYRPLEGAPDYGANYAGSGYMAGDIITISGGNGNAKFVVQNVSESDGQIVITEYDPTNMTISGTFRFNATKTNDNPLWNETLNFQEGHFYKVPIYPSL